MKLLFWPANELVTLLFTDSNKRTLMTMEEILLITTFAFNLHLQVTQFYMLLDCYKFTKLKYLFCRDFFLTK